MLENTTAFGADYHSFLDFSDGGHDFLDKEWLEQKEFTSRSAFSVTLSVVLPGRVVKIEKTIMVDASRPSFYDDDVAALLAGTCLQGDTGKTWVWSKLAGAYGVGSTGTGGNDGHDSADPIDMSYYSSKQSEFFNPDGSSCAYDDKYTFEQNLDNAYINQNNGDYYLWVWSWANKELGLDLAEFADGCYESPELNSSSWSIEYKTGADGKD